MDAGKQSVSQARLLDVIRKDAKPSMVHCWFERHVRLSVAAACVVLLLVTGLCLNSVYRERNDELSPAILGPVRAAVEVASMWGPVVLPGGEQSLDETGSIYRSGYVPLNDSLESSLSYLYEEYQHGTLSRDVAYWLAAGHVVTGQIDVARDLVYDARNRHPDDPRIATLDALVAYVDGDCDRSQALLRGVLDTNPDDPIASINLAIVLGERGRGGEAKRILARVRQRHAGTPLAERARSILSGLQDE